MSRSIGTTLNAWHQTGKLDRADAVFVQLLREAGYLLDRTRADADESNYTAALVLGKVTDVVRLVADRVAPDDAGAGPSLVDLLTGVLDQADTGPDV